LARQYTLDRQQFGSPLAANQLVRMIDFFSWTMEYLIVIVIITVDDDHHDDHGNDDNDDNDDAVMSDPEEIRRHLH
jgi:hypothetical protein